MNNIEQNIQLVQKQIAGSAQDSGRSPDSVTLIPITKTFSREIISQAIAAGLKRFGENRIQEAEPKILSLRHLSDIEWHMVGHLQSNKAKRAAELFNVIHSLDSVKLAKKRMKRANIWEKLSLCYCRWIWAKKRPSLALRATRRAK